MQRTPVFNSRDSGDTFAHGLDERLQVLERAAGEHPVTQIENVARAAGREAKHTASALDDTGGRSE
jgi:hypothetical protein